MGAKASQSEVYDQVGRGVVEAVCDGYHGTVLAYGISGSGKTYTTFGPEMIWKDWALSESVPACRLARPALADPARFPHRPSHTPRSMHDDRIWKHVGIVPRALRDLFERLGASEGPGVSVRAPLPSAVCAPCPTRTGG